MSIAQIEEFLQVDPLELEIGYGLIPLVDVDQGGDLLESRDQRDTASSAPWKWGSLSRRSVSRDNIQLANPASIRDQDSRSGSCPWRGKSWANTWRSIRAR